MADSDERKYQLPAIIILWHRAIHFSWCSSIQQDSSCGQNGVHLVLFPGASKGV